MLKKLLMLPIMAFALVLLTGATVTDDGEDIFEWEVVEEDVSLPEETPDSEETSEDTGGNEFNTAIYDNETNLDIYISRNSGDVIYLYYNFNDTYTDFGHDHRIDTETSGFGDLERYVHIEITNYPPDTELSFIGSAYDAGDIISPDFETLDTFSLPTPTIFEEVGGALSTIVTAGSSVFVSTFDGLWDVFWDADANDGDGALNWITYVAVLPVGFVLVRWAFRKVLGMIQQRL